MKTSLPCPLLVALAVLTLSVSSLSALDFTLHKQIPANGDARLVKSYFLDGDSKIFMDFPPDWKVTDSPQSLDFLPPHAGCHVLIEQAGRQPWPFDESGKTALRKRVTDSVPQGAKNIQPLPEQANLIPFDGWSSFEVGQAYEFFGQKMCRSVLFVNLPEHRVWQVTITTPEADAAGVHGQIRQMLYGMFEPNKMLSGSALQRYKDGNTD